MLRLAHDLIRSAAADEIRDDRRRELHRRLGEWLAQIAGSDVRRLREAVGHIHAAGGQPVELANRLVQSPQRTLLGTEGLRLLASIADEADPLGRGDAHVGRGNRNARGRARRARAGARALVARRGARRAARSGGLRRSCRPRGRRTASRGAADARDLLEQSRGIETEDEVLRLEQTAQDAAILLWLEQRTAEGQAVAREAVAEATRLAEAAGGVQALDCAHAPRLRRCASARLRGGSDGRRPGCDPPHRGGTRSRRSERRPRVVPERVARGLLCAAPERPRCRGDRARASCLERSPAARVSPLAGGRRLLALPGARVARRPVRGGAHRSADG